MRKIVSSVGIFAGGLAAIAIPFVASAQYNNNVGTAGQGAIYQLNGVVGSAGSLVATSNNVLNMVIGLLIAVEVIVFIVSVIRFVLRNNDEESRKNAKKYLIWSVIAIAVTIGIFGIAKLLLSTFGINGNNLQPSDIPTTPVYGG